MNSEAKNRPPRKPKPSETAEAAIFTRKMVRMNGQRDLGAKIDVKRAVAGGQRLRREHGERDQDQSADRRTKRVGQAKGADPPFDHRSRRA